MGEMELHARDSQDQQSERDKTSKRRAGNAQFLRQSSLSSRLSQFINCIFFCCLSNQAYVCSQVENRSCCRRSLLSVEKHSRLCQVSPFYLSSLCVSRGTGGEIMMGLTRNTQAGTLALHAQGSLLSYRISHVISHLSHVSHLSLICLSLLSHLHRKRVYLSSSLIPLFT